MPKIRFFNMSQGNTYTVKASGDDVGFALAPYMSAARDTNEGHEWMIYQDPYTFALVKAVSGHNQAVVLADSPSMFFPTGDGAGERVVFISGGRTAPEG